jgi:hypothetical protein
LLQSLAPDVNRFDQPDGIERFRESGWGEFLREILIPAGVPGRYDLYMGSHEAGQFLPTTAERLLECSVIRNAYRISPLVKEREYHASLTRMYLLPRTTAYRINWTFKPWDSRNGCRIRVYDATNTLVTDKYLLKNQPGHEILTLHMNGSGDPPIPWKIDCGPVYSMEAASADALNNGIQNLALLGPNLGDLYTMLPLIPVS